MSRVGERSLVNSLAMRLVAISPGRFTMGADAHDLPLSVVTSTYLGMADYGDPEVVHAYRRGEYDEHPRHDVDITRPFHIGVTPVTNAQYEQFDPSHRVKRGKCGFSTGDDEAVIQVSWFEAMAFCDWLTQQEGQSYRLPTEAEWEFTARAGTTTAFHMGDQLHDEYQRNQTITWYPDPTQAPYDLETELVSLQVGTTPANAWGLHDVHGLVEEWCIDWYGPYQAGLHVDPVGYADGDFKITRGGSHGTDVFYLRSANRAGALPEDSTWNIGFRVVCGPLPSRVDQPIQPRITVSQNTLAVHRHGVQKPLFPHPRQYVKVPADAHGPIFAHHNHCPSIVECPNGDLLAIWFSCEREVGREMTLVSSRLRAGMDEWDDASLFWDAPDRNMTGAFLWREGKVIHWYGGLGTGGTWGQMIIYHRQSVDSGASWSPARIIIPDHQNGQAQPANSVFRANDGSIIVPGDDNAVNGTRLYVSHDNGESWHIPPGRIAGIHAAVTQTESGELLAFGRMFRPESETMPKSSSVDLGQTFVVEFMDFDSIGRRQRAVVVNIADGPIILCSFAHSMHLADGSGRLAEGSGLYAAVSYDDGKTWPIKRLVTIPEGTQVLDGGRRRGAITIDRTHAEPEGYLAAVEGRDGTVHLVTSRNHYMFNLAWLEEAAEHFV